MLGSGTSYGVDINSSDVLVQSNIVFDMTDGLFFIDGTGLYKDNTVIKTRTPFAGSLSGGNNNSNN